MRQNNREKTVPGRVSGGFFWREAASRKGLDRAERDIPKRLCAATGRYPPLGLQRAWELAMIPERTESLAEMLVGGWKRGERPRPFSCSCLPRSCWYPPTWKLVGGRV